jgi:hypothetical protein
MLGRTSNFIRAMLTSKITALAGHIDKAPSSLVSAALVELEETTAALCDFTRDGNATADDAAIDALKTIETHHAELAQLDDFFEKGSGKGSKTHLFVRRLRTIAEPAEVLDAPVAAK